MDSLPCQTLPLPFPQAYQAIYRLTQAEALLQQALTTIEQTVGTNTLEFLAAQVQLAAVYSDRVQYSRAEELFRRDLALRTHLWESEDSHPLQTLEGLGKSHRNLGHYDSARGLLESVLRIADGGTRIDIPSVQANLAIILADQGDYMAAQQLFQTVIVNRQAQLPLRHPDTLLALHNLATNHWNLGHNETAETLYEQVLILECSP